MVNEEMNCKERLYATLEQKPVDRVPCPGILQTGTVDLMDVCGAYWPDAHFDAEKMAKLAWAAYEFAGLEGVRVPFAAHYEVAACGARYTKWKKDSHPQLETYPVTSLEDIDILEIPDPYEDKYSSVTTKAIEILSEKCDKEKIPLIGHTLSAFVLAGWGLNGGMKGRVWLKKEPNAFRKLVQKAAELNKVVSETYINAGAGVIIYNTAPYGDIDPMEYKKLDFSVDKKG